MKSSTVIREGYLRGLKAALAVINESLAAEGSREQVIVDTTAEGYEEYEKQCANDGDEPMSFDTWQYDSFDYYENAILPKIKSVGRIVASWGEGADEFNTLGEALTGIRAINDWDVDQMKIWLDSTNHLNGHFEDTHHGLRWDVEYYYIGDEYLEDSFKGGAEELFKKIDSGKLSSARFKRLCKPVGNYLNL